METSFLLAYARFYRIDHGYFKRERNKNMDSPYPKIFLFTLEENECKMADVHDSHSYVVFICFVATRYSCRFTPEIDPWQMQGHGHFKSHCRNSAQESRTGEKKTRKKVVLSRIFVGERSTWFHNGLKQGLGKEKKGVPGDLESL